MSVYPRYRDPLRGWADFLQGSLQDPDGLIDVVVHWKNIDLESVVIQASQVLTIDPIVGYWQMLLDHWDHSIHIERVRKGSQRNGLENQLNNSEPY